MTEIPVVLAFKQISKNYTVEQNSVGETTELAPCIMYIRTILITEPLGAQPWM